MRLYLSAIAPILTPRLNNGCATLKSLGWLALLSLALGWGTPVLAASNAEPYAPPELAYANDLRQTVTVPKRVNINQTGLNQLKALPGLDEELALKVLRLRPFEGVQDFYRKMPDLSKKNMDLLIQQLQTKVMFK